MSQPEGDGLLAGGEEQMIESSGHVVEGKQSDGVQNAVLIKVEERDDINHPDMVDGDGHHIEQHSQTVANEEGINNGETLTNGHTEGASEGVEEHVQHEGGDEQTVQEEDMANSNQVIAVDENGHIIATGAEAERLIAEHQALQEQMAQQQNAETMQQEGSMIPSDVTEEQMFQAVADQQMMEAATGEPMDTSNGTANESAQEKQEEGGALGTDILQQAFEQSGASNGEGENAKAAAAAPVAEEDPATVVERAVAAAHHESLNEKDENSNAENTTQSGTATAEKDSSGAAVVKPEQGEKGPNPPLGSCENPIQIIQQGNTYHSTQTLSPDQLQQIAQVLQQQQVSKAIQNGRSAVVYNPHTNTRIIYRVIYPSGKDKTGNSGGKGAVAVRVGANSSQNKTPKPIKQHPRGYKGRGRPPKKSEDDINAEGASMTKEEKEMMKRQIPRTRSGRISRPPKYMVRDYKRIHHLDFLEEPPADESDGGYSDIDVSEQQSPDESKPKKRKLGLVGTVLSLTGKPKAYKCTKCDRSYISALRLEKHFRATEHGDPKNLPAPISVDEIIQSEEEAEEEKEPPAKRKPQPQRSYAEMVSTRRRNKLREAMRQCNDKEILDVCLHRVVEAATMWQLLLAKSEDGDPPVPDVPLMLVNLETLLQQTEKLGRLYLSPTDEIEGDDVVELVDEMVAAALGDKPLGFYKVSQEAYNPINDFLVKPNPNFKKDAAKDQKKPSVSRIVNSGAVMIQSPSANNSFNSSLNDSSVNSPSTSMSHSIVQTSTIKSRTSTPNVVVSNRPTPVHVTKSSPMMYSMSPIPPPSIVRRTQNVRTNYVPPPSNVTMVPNRFTPSILSSPKPNFKVVSSVASRGVTRPAQSILKSPSAPRSNIYRVTPQSVRNTSLLSTSSSPVVYGLQQQQSQPISVTPAQHMAATAQVVASSSSVPTSTIQQHVTETNVVQSVTTQQQVAESQEAGSAEVVSNNVSNVFAESADGQVTSLVVGEIYEDENGQQVIINEDGTVTPVQTEVAPQSEQAVLEQEGVALEQALMEENQEQGIKVESDYVKPEVDGEEHIPTQEEQMEQDGQMMEQVDPNMEGQEHIQMVQEPETTTATVTAVIGEGDATVALALAPDANGVMCKQIVLADGQVLGTCTNDGEISLSTGVQLIQQGDGTQLLQPPQGNIQVPLDTVRALFSMEQQSIDGVA